MYNKKITNIKKTLSTNITNILGRKIKDRLVIIESDDWGTIRMSSKHSYKQLLQKGYAVDKCAYNRNDALECNEDLICIFEVLNSIKGSDGRPAILTYNNIVANPDFEKIKASNFQEYYYEPFFETLKKHPSHNQVMNLYQEGIASHLIKPQFHGREHVHINNWLNALRTKDKAAHDAFEMNMFSVFKGNNSNCYQEFLNAMATYSLEDKKKVINSLEEGLSLFESIWGFKSITLIAPCYNWHRDLEETFFQLGVQLIQSGRAQNEPLIGSNKNRVIRRFMGEKNRFEQKYSIRNVIFEPAIQPTNDWVNSALKEVNNAFFWNQPAVISSHRLNYIGSLNEKNREKNLKLLKYLLQKIVTKWPDTRFVSSDQLINFFI